MRHLISIASLLTVFFWVGSGLTQHVSARSVFVLAFEENKKLSKEEAQAKAQAKRRYDNFMKVYNKIWSIYGFYHDEFNGTPENVRYARIVKNWQSYEKHRKTLLDITDKLRGPSDLDAQAKAEGFADRKLQLKLAAFDLNSDIEQTRIKLAELKKEAAGISERGQVANAAMIKACAAKTKVQAKPFAEQSIKAASNAIARYKYRLRILPEIEEKRQKYEALHSELESLGSFAREHRDVYKEMIDSEKAMAKDLQEVSAYHYLQNKRERFDDLVTKLDKHHSELNRVLYPYKNHDWAKTMKDDAHATGVRVGTITKEISSMNYDDLLKLGETFRSRSETVSIPVVFNDFVGVGKKLETFYGLVNPIKEVDRACKASAIAARDDAKKALACAKKLPSDEPPNSNKDYGCPSSWNRCGNHCCPPDVPCWDYGAIERAVRAGRCRSR